MDGHLGARNNPLPMLFIQLGKTLEEESHRWVCGVFWLQVVLGIPATINNGLIRPHNECLRHQVCPAEAFCQHARTVFGALVTNANAVEEAVAVFEVLNDDRPELRFDKFLQPLSIAPVSKGSHLYRENPLHRAARPKSQNLRAYLCSGWHVRGLSCRRRS